MNQQFTIILYGYDIQQIQDKTPAKVFKNLPLGAMLKLAQTPPFSQTILREANKILKKENMDMELVSFRAIYNKDKEKILVKADFNGASVSGRERAIKKLILNYAKKEHIDLKVGKIKTL